MSKIERRRRVVQLHQGNYEADLAALMDKMWAAKREEAAEAEANKGPQRAGQKPKPKQSIELARQYDALVTEAEESAEKVTVWALSFDEWDELSDAHPPRDDIPGDKEAGVAPKLFPEDRERGVNAKTFPPLLLRAALVDPGAPDVQDLAGRIAKGDKILADLGLSRIHYVKLETAAWNVNVGDDALPKFSLVSLLTQEDDDGSEEPNDTE